MEPQDRLILKQQVLGIRDEKTRMKVTPPLAIVAPITQEDDMRWNHEEFT